MVFSALTGKWGENALEMLITTIGAILTMIGTAVTIWQASKVKSYRRQISFEIRKIRLSEISEIFRRSQDEVRKLCSDQPQLGRGKNYPEITNIIQSYIEQALHRLPLNGPDSDVRNKIVSAQDKLRNLKYNSGGNRSGPAESLQDSVQEIISLCQGKISPTEQEN